MAGREYVDIIPGLWSLGVQYYDVDKVSPTEADPEMTILKSLKQYWNADDVFMLMLSTLKFRIGSLIHVERLTKLAGSGFLSENEIILLISVASKMVEDGDLRFNFVRRKLYKKGMKLTKLPDLLSMPEGVKVWGAEKSLLEFGAKVRKFDLGEKKLASVKTIFKRNDWLRIRALMGANYRADIVYLIGCGQAKTAYEAAKIAGCGNASAYRLFKYIKEFDNLGKILKVS